MGYWATQKKEVKSDSVGKKDENMNKKSSLELIDYETMDQRDELLNRLKASEPEAFSDGNLDVEALKLGYRVVTEFIQLPNGGV